MVPYFVLLTYNIGPYRAPYRALYRVLYYRALFRTKGA